MFEMAGKWVNIDPSQWRKRTKMSVNVGLGSGNREESRANLMMLSTFQEKLAPLGLVGPKQAYETFKMGVNVLGYENAEKYAMDPSSPEYAAHMQQMAQQPQPQAPQVQAAQIKAQSEQMTEKSAAQRDVMKLQGQLAVAQANLAAANARSQVELEHAGAQAQMDRAHEAIQGQADRQSDMHGVHGDMAQTLIKVIGQIVAAQLKQNASADAGAIVKRDYQEVQNL